jgi:hypothetical protein
MANKNRDFDGVSQRIKEVEAPGMWQDFYGEIVPFSRVSGYKNDFHSWIADEWTITEVGTSLQVLVDARNGILRLTSGGTENDGSNLQLGGSGDSETVGESFIPAAGKNLWFEAYIRSDDVTQHDFFVGLSIQDTAICASYGADLIGFRTDDGDALLDFTSSSTASGATSDTGLTTLVDNTWYKVGFKVWGTSKIDYYVNDVLKGSTTNVPSTEMKLSIAHLTGEGNAASLDVDFIQCWQDR